MKAIKFPKAHDPNIVDLDDKLASPLIKKDIARFNAVSRKNVTVVTTEKRRSQVMTDVMYNAFKKNFLNGSINLTTRTSLAAQGEPIDFTASRSWLTRPSARERSPARGR